MNPTPRDILIHADGQHGRNATRGQDGHSGYASGSDGSRGTDASQPTPGQAGGTCQVHLSTSASRQDIQPQHLLLERQVQPSQEPQPLASRDLIPLHDIAHVVVHARGGHGGHGAPGGHGGDGATGSHGRDATRHSRGSDGGRGGDGGDGGRGSSGARGGAGGTCHLLLDERDLYILMAVAHADAPERHVQGGQGGRAGKHGLGGQGGSGGPGGSSYSWTETENYTDSEGNTQSRTTHHSNPGGSRGPSGSRGWTPTEPLHPGAPGKPGTFFFHVQGLDGTRTTYRERYDLQVTHFEFQEDDAEDVDGIFEFGEIVHLVSLTLCNMGHMPSPAHQRVRVIVRPTTWTRPLEMELFVERSLAPDEEIVLPGSLAFQIPLPKITSPGEPFIARDPVQPLPFQLGPEEPGQPARNTVFQRLYHNATFSRVLTAQFPVENRQGIVGLRSLAPGELTALLCDVANISERAIGSATPRARRVGVQLEFIGGEEASIEDIVLRKPGAADPFEEIDLAASTAGFAGYFEDIPQIEPHTSAHLELAIGFRLSAPHYSSVTLRASIWIETHHERGSWRLVQQRVATFRSEPAYRYRPESHIVLVTNNNTSRQAFLAWQELLETQLGLPFDHWSLARYGHFDHGKDLDDGTNLRVHLEDKIAVILNNRFQPRGSEKESDLPSDYIKGTDVRHGATSNNTHFLLLGDRTFQARQLLEPTSDFRRHGDDFPSIKRFLIKEEGSVGTFEEETFKDDITMTWDEVAVHDWTFFSTPNEGKRALMMRAQSQKLMQSLCDMHPHRRYLLVEHHETEPVRDGRSWLIFPRWKLGKLEVRRTLNMDTTSTIVLHADDDRHNDPDFILSPQTRYAILLALPFDLKLSLLNGMLRNSEPYEGHQAATGRALVLAIMTDLCEEQSAVMLGKGDLDDTRLQQKLANLGRLVREPLHTHLTFGSKKWDILFELCASIEALSGTTPWWKLWGRERTMNRYVQRQIDTWRTTLFDAYALDPEQDVAMDSDSARVIYQQRTKELLDLFQGKKEHMKQQAGLKVSLAEIAREHFERPNMLDNQLQRDIDVWKSGSDRIWTSEDLADAAQREARRVKKQEELQRINAETRQSLLVTPDPSTSQATPEVELDLEEIEPSLQEVLASQQVAEHA